MIDYLVLLWIAKYRDALRMQEQGANDAGEEDPTADSLEIGAGLTFQPRVRERPQLRVVK